MIINYFHIMVGKIHEKPKLFLSWRSLSLSASLFFWIFFIFLVISMALFLSVSVSVSRYLCLNKSVSPSFALLSFSLTLSVFFFFSLSLSLSTRQEEQSGPALPPARGRAPAVRGRNSPPSGSRKGAQLYGLGADNQVCFPGESSKSHTAGKQTKRSTIWLIRSPQQLKDRYG